MPDPGEVVVVVLDAVVVVVVVAVDDVLVVVVVGAEPVNPDPVPDPLPKSFVKAAKLFGLDLELRRL